MNTNELVAMLANRVEPVDPWVAARRFGLALLGGLAGVLLLMLAEFGLRADLAQAVSQPMFWVKLAFPSALTAGALWASARLGRPGVAVGAARWGLATPVVALWLLALVVLAAAEPGERLALVLGQTWRSCALNITFLSLPALAAVWWALKGLAPTAPRRAGAAGGLLAGALATTVYTLHCPEMAAPFWAVWYLAGMAVPALLGAWLGPRLLRW